MRLVGRRLPRVRGVRLGPQPPRPAGRGGGGQGAHPHRLPRTRRAQPRAAGGRGADLVRRHTRWESLCYW